MDTRTGQVANLAKLAENMLGGKSPPNVMDSLIKKMGGGVHSCADPAGDGVREGGPAMISRIVRLEDCRENFRDAAGRPYLVRCPHCQLENLGPAVASGECAWCGWKAEATPEKDGQK